MESVNISDRAMLVRLSVSQWTAAKNDRKVNKEVADNHNSAEDMGKFKKSLVAKEALKKLSDIRTELRDFHYTHTLPWIDGGSRILSSTGSIGYFKEMNKKVARYQSATDELIDSYDSLVEEARVKLNGLFDSADYPPISQIRSKFGVTMEIDPVAVASDFRVKMSEAEVNSIRGQIERAGQQRLQEAMKDIWTRIQRVVAHMVDRLKSYEVTPEGKVKNKFHDTLITNVTDLLDILPSLNITDDANLSLFGERIKKELTVYTPDQLRENVKAREETAAKAADILSKMQGFI